MSTDIQKLPDKIKQIPHWRIIFRPVGYNKRFDLTPGEMFALVAQSQLNLRGWPYPFLEHGTASQIRTSEYVATGESFVGIEEYWRLYYSGQFIHLFSVREKAMPDWDEKLRGRAKSWITRRVDDNLSDVPGFLDITNTLHTLTEIFEFTRRFCGKNPVANKFEISITLNRIEGFALMAGPEKFWHGFYAASDDTIKKTWTLPLDDLMANSSRIALDGTLYFLSMFGWDNPSVDIFRQDQEKFLPKTK